MVETPNIPHKEAAFILLRAFQLEAIVELGGIGGGNEREILDSLNCHTDYNRLYLQVQTYLKNIYKLNVGSDIFYQLLRDLVGLLNLSQVVYKVLEFPTYTKRTVNKIKFELMKQPK